MGCFRACFGGGGERRKSRARSPPLPDHVGKASSPADVVVKAGASPPLPEPRDLAPPPPPMEVAAVSPGKEHRESSEQKTLTAPTLDVAEEGVPGTSPGRELRQLSENKVSPARSLPDEEGELSEPVKCMKDEDGEHMHKSVLLPENHRYGNCTDSDDDNGDEYGEDDNYDDDEDEDSEAEEDFVDCKIDLVDEAEVRTEENTEESHESLFSLPMSKDRQNDQEVSSPVPKSSVPPAQEESPLIHGNNHRDRSQHVPPVLNSVQNLSQWKEVKAQAGPVKKLYKENVNSVPDVGASLSCKVANQTKKGPSNSSKGEDSVDASLSTREERPVLGALTVDDLKQSSATPSPRRSPGHSREEAPILGTVGSYWSSTKQGNEYCSSRSYSGSTGIPNTTSKYREDKRVNWHSTPFDVRVDKALKKSSARVAAASAKDSSYL